MREGDVIESSIWLDGKETPEQRREHEELVKFNIDKLCEENGYLHGPVMFVEKKPGEERVPPVPKHIEESADDLSRICLLVAEAAVTGKRPLLPKGSFLANLDKHDLERLRSLTKSKAMDAYGVVLSDHTADQIIEEAGPEAAVEALRNSVNGSRYH